MLTCVADAPARCIMLEMMQFNGKYGCPCCYAPGETLVFGPKQHSRIYPYDTEHATFGHPKLWTHEETLQYGKNVEASHATSKKKEPVPEFGVKGISLLFGLGIFDVIRGTAIDYMHCVLLGIVKKLIELWFDVSHKDQVWLVHGQISMINERLSNIHPPNFISRRPRSLEHLSNWKAPEFRSFLLFYSAPVLFDILPSEYFSHYMLLVYAISVLLQNSISVVDIKRAGLMLKQFCIQLSDLYYLFNVHCLLHLTTKVTDLGPLWAHSCFFMKI